MLRRNALNRIARTVFETRAVPNAVLAPCHFGGRCSPYSTQQSSSSPSSEAASSSSPAAGSANQADATSQSSADDAAATKKLQEQLDKKDKMIAELKDAGLRARADFENLQKITTREKALAKDFALTAFAKDLIKSIDILALAIKSIPADKVDVANKASVTKDADVLHNDLISLHQGVSLTKKEIETVLKRHGVVAFDPTGEPFDPNRHEAVYQAPIPGKEPGTVLECQEIGYMIKDRLLRPAKVGVVLGQSE